MNLILASKSPRRIALLKELGFTFDIIPSQNPETSTKKRPAARVSELAEQKAFDVAQKYPGAVVIGADTLVFCKGEIIGKPKDKKDALRILNKLNGSWQSVYTGVCIMCLNEHKMLYGYDISKCKARTLSPEQLDHLAGKHMDKAGAYAIQGRAALWLDRMEGDYYTIMGLPLSRTVRLLTHFV